MNLSFPISPEQIREGMKEIIERIKEETKWDTVRTLADVSISIGEAPEYGQFFGVTREPKSIIFGSWIDQITPNTIRFNQFEFLIVRESISFFFEEKYLFSELKEITNFFLNMTAISFLRKEYDRQSLEIRLTTAKSRFLFIAKDVTSEEKLFYNKMYEVFSLVISQTISIKLIRNTYYHFVEDTPFDELDYEEILDYFIRYLSDSPEEIISPIRLKNRTLQVLQKIVEFGFTGTTPQIAESLDINTSTISRELNQIAARYNAKFRVEKNFYKLGLHHYHTIIRLEKGNNNSITKIIEMFKSIRYFGEIYQGSNENLNYIYCISLCPEIVAENLRFKLKKYRKSNVILSFEVKPASNRIFRTALIGRDFKPSLVNYRKLMNNEISCLKLTTWKNTNFEQDVSVKFKPSDKNMLRFLGIYQSNGIVNFNFYKVNVAELNEFLEENGYNPRNQQECITFMNRIRNTLLKQKLIDFRLELTLTNKTLKDRLVIKIKCNPKDEKITSLLERLSVFSWILIFIGSEDVTFSVYGLDYKHPISKLLFEEIENEGFEYEYFSKRIKVWRNVPLGQLFSFQDKKWFLK